MKKCSPTTWAGRAVATEISVTESEEVFVARIACAGTMTSSAAKISRLSSRRSGTASTTRSTPARSLRSVEKDRRPRSTACSASVILPRFTARAVEPVIRSCALASASSDISMATTSMPLRAITSAMPLPIVPSPITPTCRTAPCVCVMGKVSHPRECRDPAAPRARTGAASGRQSP